VTAFRADRAYAGELDAGDPLAGFRDRFVRDGESLIYLDGNSLGMLPLATAERIGQVVRQEWGGGLIRSWEHWIGLPLRTGDLLGRGLLGAGPGQVAVCDSTTVNLYKLARAALDARPGRTVILTDDDNFPTDRYVLAGVAAERGAQLKLMQTDLDAGLSVDAVRAAVTASTALVCLSHVAYRSGALADMALITQIAHERGALVLWDLCHSAGAVPVDLDGCGADLAVGCTYKYLNAGPGAPAFLYVRRELAERLRQPVHGWFGQRNQFAMGPSYDPAPGIGQFLTGTPDIIGTAAVGEGVRLLAEAGIGRLRRKGQRLTGYLIALADAWLAPLGFTLASPRDPDRRGSHVCLHHPDAAAITRALIEVGVVGDYRTPDRLRLGPAPITTSFTDVWHAMDRIRKLGQARAAAEPARLPDAGASPAGRPATAPGRPTAALPGRRGLVEIDAGDPGDPVQIDVAGEDGRSLPPGYGCDHAVDQASGGDPHLPAPPVDSHSTVEVGGGGAVQVESQQQAAEIRLAGIRTRPGKHFHDHGLGDGHRPVGGDELRQTPVDRAASRPVVLDPR
jgi:kynureninase